MGAKSVAERNEARKRAMRMWEEGIPTKDIALKLGVTKAVVNLWWRLWQQHGESALTERKRGPRGR
jgi:uncharacterized protein YjcR